MVAINSENSAISEYDSIIASNDIPDDVKATFEEIRNDEKDHLVILTTLVNNNTKKDLPNNGEKEGS
jgi:rubrerythrin